MQVYKHWSDYPKSQWRWPDFSPREMASKGEGELGIDPVAMDRLQALRDRLGRPLIITSAYRSEAHNRRVGGAKNSYHKKARAFDIRMDNQEPVAFERAAIACGFRGFGYYPHLGFMHIDTGPARSWGKPWRAQGNKVGGLPPEPPRAPEKPAKDPAVVGTAIGGGGAVAAGGAVLTGIGALSPTAQIVAVAGLVVVGIAVVVVLRKQLARYRL